MGISGISIFHRRRVRRLAQLLDDAPGDTRRRLRPAHHGELAYYVQLCDDLATAGRALPGPSQQFQDRLKAQLMAAAKDPTCLDHGDTSQVRAPLVTRGRVLGAILIGLVSGTLALGGMSTASNNPGDPLYGLKRSAERARLALSGSDVSRGRLYLRFAETRLSEAETVGGEQLGDMDTATVSGVRLLTRAALSDHDRAPLDAIDAFVARQRVGLTQVGNSARVHQSLALLERVAVRSARLRPTLTCVVGVVRSDDLGAIVPNCVGGGVAPAAAPAVGAGGAARPGVTPTGTARVTNSPGTNGWGGRHRPGGTRSAGIPGTPSVGVTGSPGADVTASPSPSGGPLGDVLGKILPGHH